MSYTTTGQDVEILEKLRLNMESVKIESGPDRFRADYQELCLTGYKSHSLWDMAEELEEKGYNLVDSEAAGLTYYSSDGKTEIYLDEVSDLSDQRCRVMILAGELTEEQLPEAEEVAKNLFYDL